MREETKMAILDHTYGLMMSHASLLNIDRKHLMQLMIARMIDDLELTYDEYAELSAKAVLTSETLANNLDDEDQDVDDETISENFDLMREQLIK